MIFPLKTDQTYQLGYKHGQMSFHGIHNGVDLIVPSGTDWLACLTGKVLGVYNWLNAGKSIDIENEQFISRVCHLGSSLVVKGQPVIEGQTIAKTDNTGLFSTGPHAHWMMFDRHTGKWFDPLSLAYGEVYRPLYTRINDAFREVFGRTPTKKENDYYLKRCGQAPPIGWRFYDDLINTMSFYKGQGKTMGK